MLEVGSLSDFRNRIKKGKNRIYPIGPTTRTFFSFNLVHIKGGPTTQISSNSILCTLKGGKGGCILKGGSQ